MDSNQALVFDDWNSKTEKAVLQASIDLDQRIKRLEPLDENLEAMFFSHLEESEEV